MDTLPAEIIYHVAQYLDPTDIVTLQLVNRRLLEVARDPGLWREQCFACSTFLKNYERRQNVNQNPNRLASMVVLQRSLALGSGQQQSVNEPSFTAAQHLKARANERIRVRANWDPSYPSEKVDWFSEYIRRVGPISVSWLQQPRNRDSADNEHMDIRGVGLYQPPSEDQGTHVVAPLDDGSVCIWDLKGSVGKKGSIVGRSASGILTAHLPSNSEINKRSNMIHTGVTECVSVDSFNRKAYIAVQNALVEVDLETLQTVSAERFPFSISALSEAKFPVPITVGTTLSLQLYDPRARLNALSDNDCSLLDIDRPIPRQQSNNFRNLLNPEPQMNYAPLFQPGPLSILHLPTSGDEWNGNGDIYVAGRFPSILNYDRRYFPRLRGTIYSGARLCGLAGLPYPFVSMDKDLMSQGELSIEQVNASKSLPGNTLIACGEYNSKGSLEMYGLSANPELTNNSSDCSAGRLQNSTVKNRQTSSRSKLLSVDHHGTSIVCSDASGTIAWFERDGVTEIRRWNVPREGFIEPRSLFGNVGGPSLDSGTGDIVRKIVNTHSGKESKAINNEDLVLWTGEKLGLLQFSSKPGFTTDSFEEQAKTLEELQREEEERVYGERLRRVLEVQADEARFIQNMSFGADNLL